MVKVENPSTQRKILCQAQKNEGSNLQPENLGRRDDWFLLSVDAMVWRHAWSCFKNRLVLITCVLA